MYKSIFRNILIFLCLAWTANVAWLYISLSFCFLSAKPITFEPEVLNMKNRFKKLSELYKMDPSEYNKVEMVPIYITDSMFIPNSTLGVCYVNLPMTDARVIIVNKSNWDVANDEEKFILYLHEMGHCVYGMEHNDNHISIMNTYLIDSITFGMYYYPLLNEYFNREFHNKMEIDD